MPFCTNWTSLLSALGLSFAPIVRGAAVFLHKSDGSPDVLQSDGSGAAKVSGTVTTSPASVVAIHAVATVGPTEAALAAGPCQRGCLVQAELANTGIVSVSGPGVTTANGIQLQAGDSVFIPCANTNLVSHIGTVAGDKLRVLQA